MIKKLTGLQPGVLSIARIVMGLIVFSFGTAKIFHFHAGEFMPAFGSPEWVAGLIELTVGLCFLIGVFTRLSAFILSGLMAAAYFTAHLPVSFFPTENGGYTAASWSFVFLYFATSGGGPASLDAMLSKRANG
ncbi:DoxX family protein [Rhizobium ruizarguesonis]|uniref:DoxX family protein n=1 Tax=Rhizobium ruizarguesonis TaxID=2081791 RepID=A0AAE8Q4K6_9HYPH|nr:MULTISPECIES: DoxX family protein [Rhizobium]NEH87404.1 DoxX family membrane protein [Rhizobium ruizarguesonis]NEI16382.1 DoxX family membrane protein [Rhizobium ruizarguesonis]NEJ08603.1 DoxX family membrane protein [Rhizobium ruizarguesonis]NEJ17011.1 DoxX family membrane protein [Rhizobium ruizarguesonis]NEJ59439.1 DoxX family membrane protein [Rhizobium ruizarguesonis]